MRFLQTVLAIITITYYHYCSEHENVMNQTLYDDIVDYFFPKELRNPKIKMDRYLCHSTLPHHACCQFALLDGLCCQCSKTCKYYGTCCIDAFFDNNITSVEEYVTLFLKMTNMRRYASYLPVTSNTNISSYFNVDQVKTVTSCENEHSPYVSLCNGDDLSNDVRVIADGFVYKNKYCALCHGFSYSFATLSLSKCKNSANISGVRMTVPDKTCFLSISNDTELGYKKESYHIETFLPEVNKMNCSIEELTLCFYSYFSLIKTSRGRWQANPQCAKCIGETDLRNEYCQNIYCSCNVDYITDFFSLLISFDDDGNYESVLTTGQPVCPWDQYFDIFSNQCKTKKHKTCEKIISSDMNSAVPSVLWRKTNVKEQLPFNFVHVFLTHGKFVDVLGLSSQSNYFFTVPYKEFTYTELYGFSPQQHLLHSRACADPQIINQSFGITSNCSVNSSGTIYNITKDVTSINVIRGSINPVAANCKQFYIAPNCSIGVLNTFIATMKNHSIMFLINNEEKIHTTEQYVSLMEGFGICHKNDKRSFKYEWMKRYYYFENVMSFTLLSISLVLELLLLIVYLTMKKARNIPDKILIAFCVALLICDVIVVSLPLIKASVDRALCKTIALILHFFSLVLCTWPCIIAFELWKILRCTNTMKRQNFSYFHYSIIAWGVPLIVTLTCLTIDLTKDGSLIRYGNQRYCWISPFHARLVVYILPYLVLNFGNFFVVFISMLQTKRERKKILEKVSKNGQINYSKMLIKLCLLFGTAELIGLVQIPDAKQKGQPELIFDVVFGLLYNFLRSSRGIFMFAAFGSNGMRQKYREHAKISISMAKIEKQSRDLSEKSL